MKNVLNRTRENEGEQNPPEFTEGRVVRVSVQKALAILATAVLGSAGAAVWGTLAVANTIPFRVTAMERDITDIKTNYQPKDISNLKWDQNEKTLVVLEKKLDNIDLKVDEIRNLIKR